MRTTKPISTISFNTEQYLKDRLQDLCRSGHVSFFAFVKHLPEDDEGGKKEHFHVYIEPSKLIQTDDFRQHLLEYDLTNPDKPKGCLKFCNSKFGDWYRYSLHDSAYLAKKGQSRRYQYTFEEFISSNDDDMLMMVRSIPPDEDTAYADMLNAFRQGMDFGTYASTYGVPIAQINQWRIAWDLVVGTELRRNGRKNHPNDFTISDDDKILLDAVPDIFE